MLIFAICLKKRALTYQFIDVRLKNLPELNSLCPASTYCTDFVYTNTTNIDPLLANLNSFFSKSESRPLTIKAFDTVDALQTYWKQNNVAVGLNVLEFNGTNLKYNIHVNNTIFPNRLHSSRIRFYTSLCRFCIPQYFSQKQFIEIVKFAIIVFFDKWNSFRK